MNWNAYAMQGPQWTGGWGQTQQPGMPAQQPSTSYRLPQGPGDPYSPMASMQAGGNAYAYPQAMNTGGPLPPQQFVNPPQMPSNDPAQQQAHFMGQNTGLSRPQMPMNGWGRFMQRPLVN